MLALMPACSKSEKPETADPRPNILWVVWDTVRTDRMSLYGARKNTTPRLEQWAKGARVFDDCISAAPYTLPSHASMFTGLLPSEHGTHNSHWLLDPRHHTLAELLREAGYQTYLYSANPFVSRAHGFNQGFDVEEHPWQPKYEADALRIVRSKIDPEDRSSELPEKLRSPPRLQVWDVKASGELAQRGALEWLRARDASRPFFIFLNYMEAHRPLIPPRTYRQRVMSPDQVARSYRVDRSWAPMWTYTVGLTDYTDEELEVIAGTYDACLVELDDLFAELLAALGPGGYLDNTAIILTSDHGEHLGEHHMLDHQFSVYEVLNRVPLVIHYPEAFAPGRDPRPVMTVDLFPTLLELAGIPLPDDLESKTVSLSSPQPQRTRLAENPSAPLGPLGTIRKLNPTWDPTPWQRSLRALYEGEHKYIWASDGRHELYDIQDDPQELHNLFEADTALSRRMALALDAQLASLHIVAPTQPVPELTERQKRLLGALGYLEAPAEGDAPAATTSEE